MAVDGKHRSRADAAMARLYGFYNAATGLWNTTDWWNAANALEATIDYSARTGATTYTHVIDNTFTQAQHTHAGFINEFFDDEGWWALAWIKAYDLTREARYLTMAETIFADMYASWDTVCGGGIWWDKNNHEHKNAIPNELLLTVAARLHLRKPGDGSRL